MTFVCNIKTYTSVNSIVWEKEVDGATTCVNIVHMSRNLTLTNINTDDRGVYRCIANNSAGSTNMSFTLQVISGKHSTIHSYDVCFIDIEKSQNSVNQKGRIFIIKADWKYQRSLHIITQ